MNGNIAHVFLPHAFIALVESLCILKMLPVCCAAIVFNTFQNVAFSPPSVCIIVLYHFFFVCVRVCFCLPWLRSGLVLLPRLQIGLYNLVHEGLIACMHVILCIFFAQSLSERASEK